MRFFVDHCSYFVHDTVSEHPCDRLYCIVSHITIRVSPRPGNYTHVLRESHVIEHTECLHFHCSQIRVRVVQLRYDGDRVCGNGRLLEYAKCAKRLIAHNVFGVLSQFNNHTGELGKRRRLDFAQRTQSTEAHLSVSTLNAGVENETRYGICELPSRFVIECIPRFQCRIPSGLVCVTERLRDNAGREHPTSKIAHDSSATW